MQLKKLQRILSLASLTVGLAACGGGGGGASTPPAETVPPVVSSVNANRSGNQITLTASATDNIGVTGYCFKTSSTTPLANDPCFQASSSITISTGQTSVMLVWAKDGAGNISTPLSFDTVAPVVASVTEGTDSGQVTLTATGTDNIAVTGYCFKASSTAPLANDPCFQPSATTTLTPPQTAIATLVWAKDAAGNVSASRGTETVAPVVTGVSVSNNSTQITFTAAATDNIGVTDYCFKTSTTTPLANDACFQASASTTVAMPQTSAVSVWAKDAAGNVSATASAGCAATGVTASQASALPTVCVSTSLGQYVLEIESVKAPITAANFLRYVAEGYYNQTVFHRVISNFMVQGGGFTGVPISVGNIKAGTVYTPIVLETPAITGVSNTLGSISMARTNVLDSATTQFFINVASNTFLDTQGGGYAAFGRVISGMNTTIESIRTLPVQSNGSEISQPLTPPVIQWAYQLK